ncbi:MAG: hypothetical protein PHW19_12890 [Salinivirgaceae bacterium]|nr:hypothetical protein [Salinivirgaceae bacterium]
MKKTLQSIMLLAFMLGIVASTSLVAQNVMSTKKVQAGSATESVTKQKKQKPQKIKEVDSNKNKRPKWINTIQKDYIIVTGSGATLDASQENALLKVKENIVRSVAENISVSSEMTTKEAMGDNVNSFFQNFEQTTQSQTGDVSFLKGIALNKAEDYYWEELKQGNNITFYYHLLYPFSDLEMRKLVMAFEKADRELTEQLQDILNKIETTTIVEDMESDITTLEKLLPKFLDTRKTKTEVGINQIKSRLKSINIVAVTKTNGSIEYELKIGSQTITTNRKPQVTNPTKCATINGIEPSRTGWRISFEAKYCYDDPNNLIRVKHTFRHATVSHDFYFDIDEDKVQVFMHAPIIFSATEQDDSNVTSGKVTFTISNKYGGTFTVDRIILNYAKAPPIMFENITQTFTGKGDHTIIIDLPNELDKKLYTSRMHTVVDGFIYYNIKGKQETYKLYQNKVTTSW